MSEQSLSSALAGLGLGLGLIVAIGAQNAFVLRQGIRRQYVAAVVLVCIASDAVLIAAGVAGAGALFTAVPWLVTVARWGGAVFLLSYAVMAARRALAAPTPGASGLQVDVGAAPSGALPDGGDRAGTSPAPAGKAAVTAAVARPATATGHASLLAVLASAVALTWLNPHVYLDTFVLLGSVGSSHAEGRWAFAAGAVTGSVLWFTSLGVGARLLTPIFARPAAWRVLDGIIAIVMTTIAVGLVIGD